MSSVSQIETHFERLFGERVNELARETRYIQRATERLTQCNGNTPTCNGTTNVTFTITTMRLRLWFLFAQEYAILE